MKMVFVKEESEENMIKPETCRIKHEEPEPEPEPCRIKHEEPEICRIKNKEPEPKPEPWRIKHKDHGGWSLFFIKNDCCTLGLQ